MTAGVRRPLARMRADVSAPTRGTLRRLLASACAVAIGAACSSLPEARIDLPQGRSFIAMVPDSVDDVGIAPSITVDPNGIPYISSFGFTASLSPDEIPVARPIGSPYLDTEDGEPAGAVLLTSLAPETQVWNRGAVAQPRETPTGVTVPFGPAAEPSLASLTPSNAHGTDVAIAGGDIHVVWAADTGLWYGVGPNFDVERVEEGADVGAPSIAVGDDGSPMIAYTVAAAEPEVRVAERIGERWRTTVVATLQECGRDCPPDAHIGIVGSEPVVAVADPSSRELIAARREGSAWSTEVIASGVTGGASLTTADETATAAYYTPAGVAIATGGSGGWSVDEVAPVAERPEPSPEPSPSPTTGVSPSPAEGESPAPAPEEPIETDPDTDVAMDGEGRVWVAWEDAEGVHLASGAEDGSFEEEGLGRTEGGVTPSVAVTEDGSAVYLAWFDPGSADLFVGISAELDGIVLAAPSPTPPPPTGGDEGCGDDGEIVLDIAAEGTAFDPTCLVAPVGEPFTIDFENRDPVTQTGPHNIAIGEDQTSVATDPIFKGDLVDGPDQVPYDVSAIDEAGTYAFRCDVHPQMTGTLAVIEAGGGQGGGDQGGGGNGGGGGSG